ncbi:ferredoxin [soil metagenome]
MADRNSKIRDNVPGQFYVDDSCTDCDACRDVAPNNFVRNNDIGFSYVKKQPETDEEMAQCREAVNGCPTESVGDDGLLPDGSFSAY